MNSVYIDSAVPSSPIYLGPNNASSVIIGNANCTTTLVGPLNIGTTTANTINIGKEGASTNLLGFTNLGIVTSGTKSSYIEVGTGSGNAVIDFHSSGLFDTDNDSRIMGTGGTSTSTQGSLNYYAGSGHNFYGRSNMYNGTTIENGLIVKSYSGTNIGQITFNNTHNAGGANFYVGHDSYTSGNFVIKVGGGQGVYLVAGGTGWTGYSDIRLKKNIEPIENSLEKICNITPIYFEYIKSDISMNYVGFSAQEVETQFPIIVTDDENGVKMIQPTSFIPYLVQSIKELKYENDNLKQKNYDHQEKITSLQTQLSSVLQRLESAGL